ncbi:hypothetical protein [Mucilaginibacter ginsenosidivorax]|uniref:Uncharacterized protein n=1 Tax=Mucilaginibacter ginsenosidivorax TaxID=862126 RepID=A0A5B8WAZ9_9SPHI|nr:hypothetical protein [Mucilaginibacter ginsenosidivorax]QEC79318.1 hypothetical protein FSB76_26455 [Mucilaginibacter ginsenosidivorax]
MSDKKTVITNWGNAFPDLVQMGGNKLFKIVGPVIIGIELIKLPRSEDYRPYFVCYSLFGNDLDECLSAPTMLLEFKNEAERSFAVPYIKHHELFPKICERVKEQLPLPFNRDVFLNEFLNMLDLYAQTPPLSAAPLSFLQAKLKEFGVEVALYTGDIEKVYTLIENIERQNWDRSHFKLCGADVEQWVKQVGGLLSQREYTAQKVAENKNNKKLEKLKKSELLYQPS